MKNFKLIFFFVTAGMFSLFWYTDDRPADGASIHEVNKLINAFPALQEQIEAIKYRDNDPTLSYIEYRKILWFVKINS